MRPEGESHCRAHSAGCSRSRPRPVVGGDWIAIRIGTRTSEGNRGPRRTGRLQYLAWASLGDRRLVHDQLNRTNIASRALRPGKVSLIGADGAIRELHGINGRAAGEQRVCLRRVIIVGKSAQQRVSAGQVTAAGERTGAVAGHVVVQGGQDARRYVTVIPEALGGVGYNAVFSGQCFPAG